MRGIKRETETSDEMRYIIEDTQHIVTLLSKAMTVSNLVDTLTADREKEDQVSIREINNNGIDTIELREMITGLDEKQVLQNVFNDVICTALLNSINNSFKLHQEINPIESLLENGINEMLLFYVIFDEQYEIDNLSFLESLKQEIISTFMKAVDDITLDLLSNKILGNYTHIEFSQYMPGGIVIFCSNKKMKVLEER